MKIEIDGVHLIFEDFKRVYSGKAKVYLAERARIRRCGKARKEII